MLLSDLLNFAVYVAWTADASPVVTGHTAFMATLETNTERQSGLNQDH